MNYHCVKCVDDSNDQRQADDIPVVDSNEIKIKSALGEKPFLFMLPTDIRLLQTNNDLQTFFFRILESGSGTFIFCTGNPRIRNCCLCTVGVI